MEYQSQFIKHNRVTPSSGKIIKPKDNYFFMWSEIYLTIREIDYYIKEIQVPAYGILTPNVGSYNEIHLN